MHGDSKSYSKNKAWFPAASVFMALYFGSFGIALLSKPSELFSGDAPTAYWTTSPMAEDTTWFARATGAALLVIGIGSRFNNMYTPIFLELCWLGNTGALGLITQAAFFMPEVTTSLCKIQFGMSLVVFLFNTWLCFDDILGMPSDMVKAAGFLFECRLYNDARGVMGFDGKFCIFMTVYLGAFGLALVSAPSTIFAAGSSPAPYWSADALSDEAIWFARFFGIGLLVMALGGSLLRVDRDVFIRQCLLFNLIVAGLQYLAAFVLTTTVPMMWMGNLGFQGLIVLANIWAVATDSRGVGMF
jgi:hypothetical protein